MPIPRISSSLILIALCSGLGACSSLSGPSSAEIARLPVVDFGKTPPAGEFVLRYPAGVDLPVEARIGGSLIEKTEATTLNVRVKRDLYVYRDRASLDGQNWMPDHQLVGAEFMISVPGTRGGKRDAVSPGEMSARFDLKVTP